MFSQWKHSSLNLLPSQRAALQYLYNSTSLTVLKSDKNLGPAIVERTEYISRVYQEHLLTDTYRQLSEQAALGWIQAIRQLLCHFIDNYTQPYS
jgi:hypothetical protein